MEFLSDEWIAAMAEAAREVPTLPGAPTLRIDHEVVGVRRWRLAVDAGSLAILDRPEGEAEVTLTSDLTTARDVAAGRRAALDAFIAGDLAIIGDATALLAAREALEAVGDCFAAVRDATDLG